MAQRIAYLDGLRGVAAFLVMIHHFMIAFYPASYSRTLGDIHTGGKLEWVTHDTPLGIFMNGGLAVALFLLLSGYIAAAQAQKKDEPAPVVLSVIKRFFRFFWLILGCNVLAYGLILTKQTWNLQAASLTGSWWWLGSQWHFQPSFWTMLQQSFFSLFRTYSLQEVYNSSLWTMPFFFLGTTLLTVVLYFTRTFPRRWVLLCVMAGLTIGSYNYLLFVGALVFEFQQRFTIRRWSKGLKWILLCGGLYFGGYPQSYTTASTTQWYQFLPTFSFTQTSNFYHGIAALCWLLLVLRSGCLQRLLAGRFWVFAGYRSFSLYVVHVIVINSFASWLFVTLIPHLPYGLTVLTCFAASLGLVLLLSDWLYRLVESQAKPISQYLGRWLARTT